MSLEIEYRCRSWFGTVYPHSQISACYNTFEVGEGRTRNAVDSEDYVVSYKTHESCKAIFFHRFYNQAIFDLAYAQTKGIVQVVSAQHQFTYPVTFLKHHDVRRTSANVLTTEWARDVVFVDDSKETLWTEAVFAWQHFYSQTILKAYRAFDENHLHLATPVDES